ncbi:MAG: response regulator [Syntrophaceae bacterium]|nr:response regulator [Syntrophaceae bacterium]
MNKIIVVDDDEQNRSYLQTLFQSQGFAVTTAVNGAKALDAAREDPPLVIISDILMPVMDGFILCKEWKNDHRLKKIPFIFYTATYTDPKDEKLALEMGADRFVTKPQEPDILLAIVRDVLNNKPENLLKTEVSEEDILKEYNEVLFRKLENKINQLEEANKTIKQSEEKYRGLIETTGTGFVIIDQKGGVLDANGEYVRLAGCKSLEQIIGKNIIEWTAEHDRVRNTAEIKRCFEQGFVRNVEIDYVDNEKFITPVEINAATIRTTKGIVIMMLCRDITDRKKTENEIRQINESLERRVRERTSELEASNKEMEAFAYSVSHDLRAPLRAIDNFSQIILEDYKDKLDTQIKDYLNKIIAASKRMAQLIDDILILSRIKRVSINIQKVNLSQMVRSTLENFQISEPGRCVKLMIADNLQAAADQRLMQIVMENLLGNAWKFTGKLEKAEIEFGTGENVNGKYFFIRDNGTGFDMAYVDKLFIPFQRLHSSNEYPGTGVGLSIVRTIMNRHGGTIWAEAQQDKGATFYFTLPE